MKKISYMIYDTICVVISLILAILLRFEFIFPLQYIEIVWNFIPIAIVLTISVSYILGVYNAFAKYFGFADLIKQCLVSFSIGSVFYLLKALDIIFVSGSVTIIYCGVFLAITSCIRSYPRIERYLLRKTSKEKIKRVIVIGAGQAGASIIKKLVDTNDLNPICILDDDVKKHKSTILGVKVSGTIDKANFFADKFDADEFLIAVPSADDTQIQTIIDKISKAQLPIRILQDVVDIHKYNSGDEKALKEVTIEDLLFRDSVKPNSALNREFISDKVVLVTGGAGSIGSELCRQILKNDCKKLLIFDINENGLFEINEEFKQEFSGKYITLVGSVRDKSRLFQVFEKYRPEIVFHAAAHKHVPMMEINPFEALKNNVFGTQNVINQAVLHKTRKFILISTDKAVNPTNVMGATKRVCELLIKTRSTTETEMVAVRFGNVLGSNGSVIPLFKRQIASGGPLTVTHKDMTRYFMTIKEAVSLVLSAGANARGAELFVLDMGKPVRIYDLASMLIKLSGREPFKDIDIQITGLRDGEKLFEELNLDFESVDKTSNDKIFIVRDNGIDNDFVNLYLNKLEMATFDDNNEENLREILFELIDNNILLRSK